MSSQIHPHYITGFHFQQDAPALSYSAMMQRITASESKSLDISYLAAASKHYHISNKVEDYVFANVRALATDIPNRNGHCFTLDDLMEFNVEYGCRTFETFKGRPILINHKYVLEQAVGFIADAQLVQEGPYVIVLLTIAIDKTKNKRATSMFMAGNCSFSMGAIAGFFECSACGKSFTLDKPCPHTGKRGLLKLHKINGESKLGYLIAKNVHFIEHSLLMDQPPADPRALHSKQKVV